MTQSSNLKHIFYLDDIEILEQDDVDAKITDKDGNEVEMEGSVDQGFTDRLIPLNI